MIAKLYKTSIKIITSLSFSLGVISLASAIPVYATSTGSVGSWTTEANTLPTSLGGVTSVVYNGHVHVIGGDGAGLFFNSVYSAPLNANGSVGAWTTEANVLPAPVSGATSVAYNGHIYVMGGYNGTSTLSTVYSAPLNANGSVGTWTTEANTLPTALYGATSVINNGHIYILGGLVTAPFPVNTVYSAPLNANGSVGTWTTEANTLPTALYEATSVVNSNHIYVLGGAVSSSANLSTVYSAPLSANGSVGTWTTEANTLPTSLGGATSVINNSHIYVMGGFNDTSDVNAVYSATLNANGSVGTWTTEANNLPTSLGGATSVINNSHIYVMGGLSGASYVNTVYSAPLTSQSSGGSTGNVVLGVPDTGFSNLVTNAKETTIKSVIAVVAILSLAYLSRKRLKN